MIGTICLRRLRVFLFVVPQKWYSPRAPVAMVSRSPGARAKQREQGRARSEEDRAESATAKAHKHAGIMEKRSPLKRIFPSDGLRLFTAFLTLYGITCELSVSLSFLPVLLLRLLKKLQWSCSESQPLVTVTKRQNRLALVLLVLLKWAVVGSKESSFI